MRKRTNVVTVGLLVICVLTAVGTGCNLRGVTSDISTNQNPFITDRVVTVRIVMTEEDWNTCQYDALMEQYVRADFWFDGELVPDVAIRPKGNSSLNQVFRSGSPRLSLKVDFNFFNSVRTFRGLKKLNFNNGFNDPTLIRECLSYELFEQMDIPTPRTAFIDLWVNDTHLGLYTQVEQIDKTFLRKHFSDPNGNLYKPEMPAAYLNWTEVDLERQQANMGIVEEDKSWFMDQINMGGGKLVDILKVLEEQKEKGDDAFVLDLTRANAPSRQPRDYLQQMGLKTNENYSNHSALLHFLDVLNNEPDDTFPTEIEKVLDVDGVLRFLAVSVLVGYYDSYLGIGHNYYLYEVDGMFTILPWDLNGSFATFTGGMSRQNMINLYIDEPTCGPMADRPLISRLLSHKPYMDTYHGYLKELLEGPFSVEVMRSRIDQHADLIRPFVYADELKFYSNTDFERSLNEDIMRTGSGEIKPPVSAPPPLLKLSTRSLACLRSKFDKGTLDELLTRRPTPEELTKLKSCLTREELLAFLQRGQNLAVPPMNLGPTFIGLKTYVVERSRSVRQQLEGKRPSAGDGSGNGGNMGMLGIKNRRPGIPPPVK